AGSSALTPAVCCMVRGNEHEATVLPTELPETIPCRALATTAALAVPPVKRPVRPNARSLKNCPIRVCTKITPKNRNKKIYLAEICRGVPNTPLSRYHRRVATSKKSYPWWDSIRVGI